ncbi:MAG TPA: hypothetical protein VKZ63_18075 [Kofleriaceae bacterium]|nr:hypothetical protein [Kofleriaceae bacterium]
MCGCQAEEPALDSGRALEFERAEPGSLIGALHDGDATIQVEACRFEGEDRETQLHARLVDGTGADLYVLGSDEHTPEWFADEAGDASDPEAERRHQAAFNVCSR